MNEMTCLAVCVSAIALAFAIILAVPDEPTTWPELNCPNGTVPYFEERPSGVKAWCEPKAEK